MHLDSATARDHAAELHALRTAAERAASTRTTTATTAATAKRTAAAQPAAPVMIVQFDGLALRPLHRVATHRPAIRARPPERWPVPTRLPRVTV